MAQEHIDFTTPGGDTVTQALHKAEDNFNDLYGQVSLLNPVSSFKNKLINPNFRFWQRGTAFAPGTGSGNLYTADRWRLQRNAMSTPQVSQAVYNALGDTTAASLGSPYGLLVSSSANTDVAGHYYLLTQPIEDVQRLAGKTVTLSVTAYNSSATPRVIAVEMAQIYDPAGSSNVTGIGAQQLSFPQGWSTQKATIAIPNTAAASIAAGNCTQMILWFSAGTNFNARAANLGARTGDLLLGALQLEEGAFGTPLEVRPLQVELALCQRYYEKSYDVAVNPGSVTTAGATNLYIGGLPSAVYANTCWTFYKVTKRTPPTVTTYSPATGAVSKVRDNTANSDVPLLAWANAGTMGGGAYYNLSASATAINTAFHWAADAEL